MRRLEIHAERTQYGRLIDLFIRDASMGNLTHDYVVQPLVFAAAEVGLLHEPCARLRIDDAQQFMDELWRAGIRPAEGAGSAGAMTAAQAHLADMRTIALGALKKEGVL